MSQVDLNNVSATSSLGELGPTTSLQLMFANPHGHRPLPPSRD